MNQQKKKNKWKRENEYNNIIDTKISCFVCFIRNYYLFGRILIDPSRLIYGSYTERDGEQQQQQKMFYVRRQKTTKTKWRNQTKIIKTKTIIW